MISLGTDPLQAVHLVEDAVRQASALSRSVAILPFEARMSAFDALSHALLARDIEDAEHLTAAGLPFLSGFLGRQSLETVVARNFPAAGALGGFVPLDGRKSLRLVPRGVVCHWLAGNVPLLGLFSWALSALVGNVNVLRLSSRQDDLLTPVLRRLAAISPEGKQIASEAFVVNFDRDDRPAHEAMSHAADVRVAWGGREAVESVMTLPCRWECETVVLGPRVSFAVVDPAVLTTRAVGRLATDIAFFDQQACSSPQVVFVKAGHGSTEFERFVDRFTAAFSTQSRVFERHPLDAGETYRIVLDRARVNLRGGLLRSDAGTQWTVAIADQPEAAVLCANRFVQVVGVTDVLDALPHLPLNVQTVVTALSPEDTCRFTDAASLRGVCRFPRPGEGNHFEDPWDGIPLLSRLVRWVVRTDPPPLT